MNQVVWYIDALHMINFEILLTFIGVSLTTHTMLKLYDRWKR